VKYALMATDLLSRQGVLKDIQELDFRGGDVVYTLKRNAPGPQSLDAAAGEIAPVRSLR
jgi:hypothetical protein